MLWYGWITREFPDTLRRDLVDDLVEALTLYRDRAVVRKQLMSKTEQIHRWTDADPELVAHADPAVWAQYFAEGWHWIAREPLTFVR